MSTFVTHDKSSTSAHPVLLNDTSTPRENQTQQAECPTSFGHRVWNALIYLPQSLVHIIERIADTAKSFFSKSKPETEKISQEPNDKAASTKNTQTAIQATQLLEKPLFTFKDGTVIKIPESSFWQPRHLSESEATKKMWDKSYKMIRQCHNKDPAVYASVNEALPSFYTLQRESTTPLSFTWTEASKKGRRPSMEDRHFITQIDQGLVAGVFDGHGGAEVADYAKQQFAQRFAERLKKENGNIHATFESLIYDINQEILQNKELNDTGCTALICFIDKNTHKQYTATVGDSSAFVCRKIHGKLKVIPSSYVVDWTHPDEAARAAIYHHQSSIAYEWPRARSHEAKNLRSHLSRGVNVSRAMGDKNQSGKEQAPLVISKPEISLGEAKPGDLLVMTCDGFDIVSKQEALKHIETHAKKQADYEKSKTEKQLLGNLMAVKEPLPLAKYLANMAITKGSDDNVTVLTIQIH